MRDCLGGPVFCGKALWEGEFGKITGVSHEFSCLQLPVIFLYFGKLQHLSTIFRSKYCQFHFMLSENNSPSPQIFLVALLAGDFVHECLRVFSFVFRYYICFFRKLLKNHGSSVWLKVDETAVKLSKHFKTR